MLLDCQGYDIAILVVMRTNDCNASLAGGSKYVSFGVDTWMILAAGVHMAGVVGIIFEWSVVNWLSTYCKSSGWVEEECENCVVYSCGLLTIVQGWFAWLFSLAWMVIGFLMRSEMKLMNAEHEACGNTVVSWCIIQVPEACIVPMLLIWHPNWCMLESFP